MRRTALIFALAVAVGACAPNRPTPVPVGIDALPWGAVDLNDDPPTVVLPDRRVAGLPSNRDLVTGLRPGPSGALEYPVLTISGGGSHGAWGAGFLKGWTEAGTRPEFRVVTAMSVGSLLAVPAFLGPRYDPILTRFWVDGTASEFYRVGPRSITSGLFGSGHFADFGPGRALLEALVNDATIDEVADEYRSGRRLYISTANFDTSDWTLWDMGAIAASDEPDRYERFRDVIAAAIAVPGAFPPVYFPVEVNGETYGQMHLDAGTNFVYVDGFMAGEDAAIVAETALGRDVRPVVYAIMNTQRRPNLEANPSGAPLELIQRAYQRIGRFASYGALDRLWVAVQQGDGEMRIAYIPDDLDIEFDVFQFPQPEMAELFEIGRRAALTYEFAARPPDLPAPPATRIER